MAFTFGATPTPTPTPTPGAAEQQQPPVTPTPTPTLALSTTQPTGTGGDAGKLPALPATRALFYALDESNEKLDDATARKLEEAIEHVAGVGSGYLKPSEAAARALGSGSIEYGGKTLKVSETTARVASACGARLRLDERQAYVVLRRWMEESGASRPTEATEEVIREVMRFYFRERLGTIKCAHALLVRNSVGGESGSDGAHDAAVTKMLERGFEENVWKAIDGHMSGATACGPEGAKAEDANAWAGQALEEMVALLEVLFLLYYNRLKCTPERFSKLAKTFETGALGRVPAACLELGSSVPQYQVNAFTDDIRALCNVTLIAAMDLENLVDRFSGKSLQHHAFLDATVIKSVTETMEKWQSDDSHGPTLLAWSTFLTLLPSDAEFMPGSFSIDTMNKKANECGLASFSRLLDAEQLRGEDPTVTLHKSVLKNMFSTILAAYDMLPIHRLPQYELNQLLEILQKILANQPLLCEQFWGGARGDGQEAPLFALMEGCRERFPVDSVPLLRALAALSEGHRAAECALAYIAQLPTVALPVPPTDILEQCIKPGPGSEMDAVAGTVRGTVTTSQRLTSPYIPGGYIEAGMSGLAIDLGPHTTPLIIWGAQADGLHLCITRLSMLSRTGLNGALGDDEWAELEAGALFLSKVLTHAPSFARPMLSCDVSQSVPKGAPADILTSLSLALHVSSKSLTSEQSIRRTAIILQALTPLAAAAPMRTLNEVLEAPLLSGTPGTGVPGLIRAIRDNESRLGEYPLTLAVLGLVETLLAHGGLGDKLEALIDHTLQEIAVRHVQWRYRFKAEKWKVQAAVQRVLHAIFTPRDTNFAMRLRDRVLSYLVNDKAICFGILAPLVYNADALRKLHEEGGAPRAEEVMALEQAIASVLKSIPLIVFHASGNFGGALEKMLLIETNNHGAPLASSIASYAGYPYAAVCCPLALPALVPLCAMAAAVPMAATLDQKDRDAILEAINRMFKHADVELDAISDAMDMLAAGIANQPEWVDMLLVPVEDMGILTPTPTTAPALPAVQQPAALQAPGTPGAALVPAAAPTPAPAVAQPAKPTAKKLAGAISLIWDLLQDPNKLRAQSPRCLMGISRTLNCLWRRRRMLSKSIETLTEKNDELWKTLEACVPTTTTDNRVSTAHGLNTMASILSLFAIELEESNASDASSVAFRAQVKEWSSSKVTAWLEMCLKYDGCSLERRKAQYMAQSCVLQCVAALERDESIAKRSILMSDATFQTMCAQVRDALLAHSAAKELRSSGTSSTAILEAVAGEASRIGLGSELSLDPIHRLLAAAREMHVEAALLVSAPLGITGMAEYGDSYLYDSAWIRVATGCVESSVDGQWGAPEGELASLGREMSGKLAETCLASSVADAQGSAVCALRTFISAAAGRELPKMHAGVYEVHTNEPAPALSASATPPQSGESLLNNLSRDARKKIVLRVTEQLAKIVQHDSTSANGYVSPLAVEVAELLSVVTQLWSISVESASPQMPAENDFDLVSRIVSTIVNILTCRASSAGVPLREATVLVHPLLTALLFAVRAWRAGAQSAKTVQPSYELGQAALPLIPLICHSSAYTDGSAGTTRSTSSVSLMLLQDIAQDLLPTSALLKVLSAHRILPPLKKATGDDDVDSVTIAALNTCLSLSHSDPGSEILLASDTIRQLAILCVESHQDPGFKTASVGHEIYCSALHVTAMLAGSSLASHSNVGEDLIRFCATLEQRMLDAMAPKQVTLAALREAEVTALFFSHLAKSFGGSWQVQDPEAQLRCRKACALFLRWLAAPQLVSGIKCPRQNAADNKLANEKPKTRAKQAWFQATARGDAVREASSPLIGVVAKGSPVADAATRKTGNAYSEAIATAMYAAGRRAAEFLASFPRAVDSAFLGFDVTAALRDQCDAVALDDFAGAPVGAAETALAVTLQGFRDAAVRVQTLEAAVKARVDTAATGASPRPLRTAASTDSPFR